MTVNPLSTHHTRQRDSSREEMATHETFDSIGRKVIGLNLPEAVLHGIFHDKACHWIPGW
jgi:hypothetical protein